MASHAQHADAHAHDTGHEHAHVIIPPITLGTILLLLLFFTALTVGAAQLEIWIAGYFNITLPAWLNIVGAMLIATIKAVLVMAYFMQLRYDSPVNTLVMLFTILGVGLFLFFTGLDLLTRDRVYDYKSKIVVEGGTGTSGVSPVATAREKWLKEWGPERFAAVQSVYDHGHDHGHGHGDAHAGHTSNANRSRAAHGLTGALSTTTAPAKHDDHNSHAPAKPADHAPGTH